MKLRERAEEYARKILRDIGAEDYEEGDVDLIADGLLDFHYEAEKQPEKEEG